MLSISNVIIFNPLFTYSQVMAPSVPSLIIPPDICRASYKCPMVGSACACIQNPHSKAKRSVQMPHQRGHKSSIQLPTHPSSHTYTHKRRIGRQISFLGGELVGHDFEMA